MFSEMSEESLLMWRREQWSTLLSTTSTCNVHFILREVSTNLGLTTPIVVAAPSPLLTAFSPLIKEHVDASRCACAAIACAARTHQVEVVLEETKVATVHHLLSLVHCGKVHLDTRQEVIELSDLIKQLGVKTGLTLTTKRARSRPGACSSSQQQGLMQDIEMRKNSIVELTSNGQETARRSQSHESNREQTATIGHEDCSVSNPSSNPVTTTRHFQCARCERSIVSLSGMCSHISMHIRDAVERKLQQAGHGRLENMTQCFFCSLSFERRGNGSSNRLSHMIFQHNVGDEFMSASERDFFVQVRLSKQSIAKRMKTRR